jgi:hypothetical protein
MEAMRVRGLMALVVAGAVTAAPIAAAAQARPSPAVRGARGAEPHGDPKGWLFTLPAGDPARGRSAFAKFECHACHEVKGETFPAPSKRESIGPELSAMGQHHSAPFLAEAIVNSPITARVIANRIWMHLVGEGIVRTPSNLGRSGARPSNPELLEYLSSRLAKQRWSLKALIREIVLSQTYQASSDASAANEKIDAGNTLFWRANRRRLDAEALRDAILAVTGDLDRLSGGESAPLSDTFRRRTIYARVGRFKQDETLALFDFPSASVSVERRAVTNVPLQKLYMLNSPFVLRQAQMLAKRIDELGIAGVYELLFARPAQQTEIRLAEEFLQGAGSKGKERYAQVLLDSNEFVFID